MNTKKYIISVALVTSIFAGVSSLALAEVNSKVLTGAMSDKKMVLEIGPNGKTLLRGTVSVVGTNSLTVKSWGGDWVININSATKLLPNTDLAQFKSGDFVGVQGNVNQTSAWSIDALLVRNWTEKKEIKQEIQENKGEVKAIIKSLSARNWEGVVVSDVGSDGSFKLKVGDATYDIKMAVGAKVVSKNYLVLAFTEIKSGDKVRVFGPAKDMVITASVIRDVSYDLKKGTK